MNLDEQVRHWAARLAEARVRYAEAFLRYRSTTAKTDAMAHQQAIVATADEITVLQAELEIAREAYRQS